MNSREIRVIRERDDLAGKISELEEFFSTSHPDSVADVDVDYLVEQLDHMRNYHRVLCYRIGRFDFSSVIKDYDNHGEPLPVLLKDVLDR